MATEEAKARLQPLKTLHETRAQEQLCKSDHHCANEVADMDSGNALAIEIPTRVASKALKSVFLQCSLTT
jgi:hypothetical protein